MTVCVGETKVTTGPFKVKEEGGMGKAEQERPQGAVPMGECC